MIRTMISAGICGSHTTITARSDDAQIVTLEIASDCQKIQGLAEALKSPIDAYQEIGDGFDGVVLKAAFVHLNGCCAGCVVPCGIFKTVQVAGGVALPATISVAIETEE